MLRRISQLLGKESSSSSSPPSGEDSAQNGNPCIRPTTTIQASNDPLNNYSPNTTGRKARKTDPPPLISVVNLFQMLPCEITLLIFSFLNVKALGKAARVCKEFNYISEFPDLWYVSHTQTLMRTHNTAHL